MFFRMIFKALGRQIGKRLMIAVTICLGASLTISMLAVMLDVGDKVKNELSSYGANLKVLPKGAAVISDLYNVKGGSVAKDALRESDIPKLKTIFWALNLEGFAPYLRADAKVGDEKIKLVGSWFHKSIPLPTGEKVATGMKGLRDWWSITGKWITDSDLNKVMIGSNIAENKKLKVGDSLDILVGNHKQRVKVSAIFHAGGEEDDYVYSPLATVQKLANRAGQVDEIEIRAITTPDNELAKRAAQDPTSLSAADWETWYCTAYVSSIAYQIEEVMPNAIAKPVRQIADSEGVILNKTQLIMSMVAFLAVVAAALGIANLVTASVMERAPEIGLLKAIGARNGAVVALILTETIIVGIIGGAVGFGLGFGLAQVVGHSVFGSAIVLKPIVLPIMVCLVVLMILVGSFPSLKFLVSLKPAQVLHGK